MGCRYGKRRQRRQLFVQKREARPRRWGFVSVMNKHGSRSVGGGGAAGSEGATWPCLGKYAGIVKASDAEELLELPLHLVVLDPQCLEGLASLLEAQLLVVDGVSLLVLFLAVALNLLAAIPDLDQAESCR